MELIKPENITFQQLRQHFTSSKMVLDVARASLTSGYDSHMSYTAELYLKRGMELLRERVTVWVQSGSTSRHIVPRYIESRAENYPGYTSRVLATEFSYLGFRYYHELVLSDLIHWLDKGEVAPRRLALHIRRAMLEIDIPKCEEDPNPWSTERKDGNYF